MLRRFVSFIICFGLWGGGTLCQEQCPTTFECVPSHISFKIWKGSPEPKTVTLAEDELNEILRFFSKEELLYGLRNSNRFFPAGKQWVEERRINDDELAEVVAILRSFQQYVQIAFDHIWISGRMQSYKSWFGKGYDCGSMAMNVHNFLSQVQKLDLLNYFTVGEQAQYGIILVHWGMPLYRINSDEFFVLDTWHASKDRFGEVWTKKAFDCYLEQLQKVASKPFRL
ncbi:MAG: hypothetical protein KDD48_07730 [Bdellovibrionales bacterium]|nr:hypothetical protein [Bdellovibrionales bacterium]